MGNIQDSLIGYVAIHRSMTVFCEEDGSCVVSASQSLLNRLLRSSDLPVKDFQKRKTTLSEITQGMEIGGAYAFDKESFNKFSLGAKKLGFSYRHELRRSSQDGIEYIYVHPVQP